MIWKRSPVLDDDVGLAAQQDLLAVVLVDVHDVAAVGDQVVLGLVDQVRVESVFRTCRSGRAARTTSGAASWPASRPCVLEHLPPAGRSRSRPLRRRDRCRSCPLVQQPVDVKSNKRETEEVRDRRWRGFGGTGRRGGAGPPTPPPRSSTDRHVGGTTTSSPGLPWRMWASMSPSSGKSRRSRNAHAASKSAIVLLATGRPVPDQRASRRRTRPGTSTRTDDAGAEAAAAARAAIEVDRPRRGIGNSFATVSGSRLRTGAPLLAHGWRSTVLSPGAEPEATRVPGCDRSACGHRRPPRRPTPSVIASAGAAEGRDAERRSSREADRPVPIDTMPSTPGTTARLQQPRRPARRRARPRHDADDPIDGALVPDHGPPPTSA